MNTKCILLYNKKPLLQGYSQKSDLNSCKLSNYIHVDITKIVNCKSNNKASKQNFTT